MNRWHNYYIDGMAHFCTSTVNQWRPLLDDSAVSILYCEWESARTAFGTRVLAYVVMPEHIHLLLWAERGENVKKFMQRVLANSSRRIGGHGKLWKERLRVLPVYSADVLRTKLNYIHVNPVKREMAAVPEGWEHSSFRQLHLGQTNGAFQCDPWPEGLVIP